MHTYAIIVLVLFSLGALAPVFFPGSRSVTYPVVDLIVVFPLIGRILGWF